MKIKKIIIVFITLLFIQIFIPTINGNQTLEKNTIYVDDDNKYGPWYGSQDHPYKNIIDGINAANNYDTVYVYNGTYQDYEIMIEKSIDLIGEDNKGTYIEDGQIILMRGKSSSISGFNLKNCIIVSERQDFIEIYNNNITGGIQINDTIESHVHNNLINGTDGPQSTIEIRDGCFSIVEFNNIFCNYEGGITIHGNSNIISNNILKNTHGNSGFGINIEGNNNKIIDNHIENNVFGIKFGHAYGNKIFRNNFLFNKINVYLFGTIETFGKTKNIWDYNYWNRPRIAPKLIFGIDIIPIPGRGDLIFWAPILSIQMDRHPTLIPYEIPNYKL